MSEFPLTEILPFISNSRVSQDRNRKPVNIPVSLQANPSIGNLHVKKSDQFKTMIVTAPRQVDGKVPVKVQNIGEEFGVLPSQSVAMLSKVPSNHVISMPMPRGAYRVSQYKKNGIDRTP